MLQKMKLCLCILLLIFIINADVSGQELKIKPLVLNEGPQLFLFNSFEYSAKACKV